MRGRSLPVLGRALLSLLEAPLKSPEADHGQHSLNFCAPKCRVFGANFIIYSNLTDSPVGLGVKFRCVPPLVHPVVVQRIIT